MPDQSYSVAEAASSLGVSGPTVKRMAADGKLDSFRTTGGHLRITAESVERLRTGGSKEVRQHREPSTVLKNRREHVEELGLEAQELRAQRDLGKLRREATQEVERDRQEELRQEREQRQAEARMHEQQEQWDREHEEAERIREETKRRRLWEDKWTAYALDSMPSNCPKEYEIDVMHSVSVTLEALGTSQPDLIIKRLVGAALEKGLREWRRATAIEKAIKDAEESLPFGARSYWKPTEWQIKVRRMAKEKITRLGQDASLEEIHTAAAEASQTVAREYEAAEAAAQRKRREDSEQQRREVKLIMGLSHVSSYLRQLEEDQEFEFEDKDRLKRKLEKLIRPELLKEIESDPGLDLRDAEDLVEDLVDEFLPEFTEED